MSDSTIPNPARTAPTIDDHSLPARGWRRLEDAIGRGRVGTIALLVGGLLLARAIRGRGRGRRLVQAIAGLALLGLGVRQRLTREGEFEAGQPATGDGPAGSETDSSSTGIDTTERTAHAVEPGSNPRDVTEEPDVETETEPDEGSVQFTTDHESEPRSEPQIEEADEGERDTRSPDKDEDEETEVDLSKTAMADEPNEAVGPRPEQAQPASTEGTEPEPTPPEDASHMQADEPSTDEHDEDGGDESAGSDETTEETGADVGEDLSTDERYEGERGDDGTVDAGDETDPSDATDAGDETDEDES